MAGLNISAGPLLGMAVGVALGILVASKLGWISVHQS